MANTYYDSQLTAEEIEQVLEAINGILTPANNGKVLAISNGKFEARSVQWGGEPVLEPLSVTANGDYTPETGVDGFDEVHVSVPNSYSASDEGKVVSNGALVAQTARSSQITQNGTYDTTLNDEVTVNVPGSSAVVQPLSVTQNGIYNPPSGVDGYAPVTVNVSGGSSGPYYISLIDGESFSTSEVDLQGLYPKLSLNDGFSFSDTNIGRDRSLIKDLGQTGRSFTFYYYGSVVYSAVQYARIVEIRESVSSYKCCMFYVLNGYGIGYSTYNTDSTTSIDSRNDHCYAIRADLQNNIAAFFVDGVKLNELRLDATGRYISINGYLDNHQTMQAAHKYAGVVEGVQSDAKIIENMQTIMAHYSA